MKLIEAMKTIKELQVKADDLRSKVKNHSADRDFETPPYKDQAKQVSEWIQAHSDVLKKILELRIAIQKTNLATSVDIQLGANGTNKTVTKTIAEWIHRRRDLAGAEHTMWAGLTDKGIQEGGQFLPASVPGAQPTPVKLRRYYDPATRDKNMEIYRSEPGVIDRTLEVVNATTELLN